MTQCYKFVFQSFYNFIDSKNPWPYYVFYDFVISTIANMVPTLITFGYNYAIVFHTNQRLSPAKKLAADFFGPRGIVRGGRMPLPNQRR